MKKATILILILIFTLLFTGCQHNEEIKQSTSNSSSSNLLIGSQKRENIKKNIFDLVEKNYDTILQACKDKNTDALYDIDGIEEVRLTDGYICIYCEGHGIVSSSQDYGFYYSEENLPVAVNCNMDIICDTDDLTPEGNGYQYIDRGHNIFYTEHIKGNIYFYSTYY